MTTPTPPAPSEPKAATALRHKDLLGIADLTPEEIQLILNTAEAMKLVQYMTEPAPLLALAQDWAVSPATKAVADDPAVRARNPGMVSNHAEEGLSINTEFWVEYGDDLEKRFNAWAAR